MKVDDLARAFLPLSMSWIDIIFWICSILLLLQHARQSPSPNSATWIVAKLLTLPTTRVLVLR